MSDNDSRVNLLRAAMGLLRQPTEEVSRDMDAKWLAPGINDLLFVSVDIEAKYDSSDSADGFGYIFHCGISILDTRVLCDYAGAISMASKDDTHTMRIPPTVDSYHFSVGTEDNETNRAYLIRRKRFKFREHHTTTYSAVARIRQILDDRPFVLVTHAGSTGCKFWNTFNIGRMPLWTIDTAAVAHHCYPTALFSSPALKDIVNFFKIPYENGELHIAGYDAHYTLRALLALTAHQVILAENASPCPSDCDCLSIQQALINISLCSSTDRPSDWAESCISQLQIRKGKKEKTNTARLESKANRALLTFLKPKRLRPIPATTQQRSGFRSIRSAAAHRLLARDKTVRSYFLRPRPTGNATVNTTIESESTAFKNQACPIEGVLAMDMSVDSQSGDDEWDTGFSSSPELRVIISDDEEEGDCSRGQNEQSKTEPTARPAIARSKD